MTTNTKKMATILDLPLGKPKEAGNLVMVPLSGNPAAALDYLLIDEALGKKEVVLEEVSEGGTVPEIRLTNFFGIIYDGRLYFKTHEATRERYTRLGMGPFTPSAEQVLKNYLEVPEEILEDGEELAAWAREAAARKGEKKGPVKKKR